jgi:hypothetical protein
MKTLATFALLALVATPALPQGTTDGTDPSHVSFRALLSPSNETPPVSGVNISGEGVFAVSLTYSAPGSISQAIVDFRVQYNAETPQTFTAMHIHRGAAGVAGPVVVDSRFGPQVEASGQGSLFRSNVITDPMTLAVIEDIMENPGGYYLNIHSTTNPAGIIRGQLESDQSGNVTSQLDRMEDMLRQIGKVLGLIFPPDTSTTRTQ